MLCVARYFETFSVKPLETAKGEAGERQDAFGVSLLQGAISNDQSA